MMTAFAAGAAFGVVWMSFFAGLADRLVEYERSKGNECWDASHI